METPPDLVQDAYHELRSCLGALMSDGVTLMRLSWQTIAFTQILIEKIGGQEFEASLSPMPPMVMMAIPSRHRFLAGLCPAAHAEDLAPVLARCIEALQPTVVAVVHDSYHSSDESVLEGTARLGQLFEEGDGRVTEALAGVAVHRYGPAIASVRPFVRNDAYLDFDDIMDFDDVNALATGRMVEGLRHAMTLPFPAAFEGATISDASTAAMWSACASALEAYGWTAQSGPTAASVSISPEMR